MKSIIRLLKDPYYTLGRYLMRNYPHLMSDRFFIKVAWKQYRGYELDLEHPQTYNEKLQWLKLYDHNPLYTVLVDKYRVKEWVADRIGEEHVIPTLAIYESVDNILLDELPEQFVLKCNHDSGSVVICSNKSEFDLDKNRNKLEIALKNNYYWVSREWPYKNVKRIVMAEPMLSDSNIKDYKIYCFDGKPVMILVVSERFSNDDGPFFSYYDLQGNLLPIKWGGMNNPKGEKVEPESMEKMIEIATILSQGLRHVRIDFYDIEGHIYFGEYTFFDSAGFDRIDPVEWDIKLGSLIKLSSDNSKG